MGKTKLVDMKIDSVDLVDQGANPDAFVRLYKRKSGELEDDTDKGMLEKLHGWLSKKFQTDSQGQAESVNVDKKDPKTFSEELDGERMDAIVSEMYDFCFALSESLTSILREKDLGTEAKKSMMLTSLSEFGEAMGAAVPLWTDGKSAKDPDTGIQKSAAEQTALNKLLENQGPDGGPEPQPATVKKEDDTMFDKSKMTPEDQAALESLEKKYGAGNGDGGQGEGGEQGKEAKKPEPEVKKQAQPEAGAGAAQAQAQSMHPEVQKALADFQELAKKRDAEIEELKKSLEIERLAAVARKYELIGKKADELAPKLYELKKAGGTAYDEFISLMDEYLNTVNKSGMFTEIGSNMSGGAGTEQTIMVKAAEVTKAAANGMSSPDAVIKAWEENPELAEQYDREYMG